MEAIVQERELLRLRLSLTQRPEPDSLLCEVLRGNEPMLDPWTVPLAEFNVMPYRGTSKASDPRGRNVLGDLASRSTPALSFTEALHALGNSLDPNEVLWLELARPKGLLPQLPWESWIQQYFEQPILRLPRFALTPVRPQGRLDIAWCSSSPRAKGEIPVTEHLGQTWEVLEQAGVEARLHVFVDAALRDEIQPAFAQDLVADGRIKVYSTGGDSDRDGDGDGRTSPLRNSWLRWMAASLPQGVDLVQFTHHGYLSRGRGALAFSRSPEVNDDPNWARFVYADELRIFLDQLGAVGFGVTSPVGNFSIAGLRSLADEIVDRRPGPVVFHDAREDPDGSALAAALAFLYGEGTPPPPDPAVTVYCHPDRLEPEVSDQELLELVEMEVKELLTQYETPGDEGEEDLAEFLDVTNAYEFPAESSEPDGAEGREGPDDGEEGGLGGASAPEEGLPDDDFSVGSGGSTSDKLPPDAVPEHDAAGEDGEGSPIEDLDWTHLYRASLQSPEEAPVDALNHVMLSRYTLATKIRPERYEAILGTESSPSRGGSGAETVDGDEKPWMRSSQRVLERHLAQLGSKYLADTQRGRAAQKGAVDGLRFVADLLGGGGSKE